VLEGVRVGQEDSGDAVRGGRVEGAARDGGRLQSIDGGSGFVGDPVGPGSPERFQSSHRQLITKNDT
jgi:hypothetical protein